jgi:O-antigen ligase
VTALTDEDIRLIENGVANYHYVKTPGLRTRILKIIMGYQVYQITGDPSGSSVMQRIEYSKASLALIKEYFWFGVGTGDIEDALISQYKKMESGLKTEYMFHAHNQYFAICITFGIFGLLWFIFALFYPPIKTRRFTDYFFLVFFLIMIWSMLSDDTLETQAGVTLFAFFYSFLLFGKKRVNAV